MAKQVIVTIPAVAAGSGSGTPLNESFKMCNENFSELYGRAEVPTKIVNTIGTSTATQVSGVITLTGSGVSQSGNTFTVDGGSGSAFEGPKNSVLIGQGVGVAAVNSIAAEGLKNGTGITLPAVADTLPTEIPSPGTLIYLKSLDASVEGVYVYLTKGWVKLSTGEGTADESR